MPVSRTISVAICGISKSGKTALTARLINKEFVEEYIPTHAADLYSNYLRDQMNVGACINIQIQDLSGDKQFDSATGIFFPGRTAIYFVVDPTLPLDQQFKMFEGILPQTSPKTLLLLVQTKVDLQSEQDKLEVAAQLQKFIKQQAEKYRMFSLFVTSSKTHNDSGIKKLLETTLYDPSYLTHQHTVLPRNSTATFFKDAGTELLLQKAYTQMGVQTNPSLDEKPEGPTAPKFGFH
jgi:small GTP-binding protein